MSHLSRLSSFFAAAAFAILTILAPAQAQTLFEGARLITGDGGVIENSAFLVTGNRPPGALYLTAGGGFGMPNAGPGGPMRDSAYGVRTEAEARADVRELAGKKPNMVKIWVDDRGGTVEKLHPDLYRAIIDEAHKNNMRVFAHVTKLEDVKDLLRTGIDGFAHMVRDRDIDDEMIALVKARPAVF